MDFVKRNEAKKRAIEDFWTALTEEFRNAVEDWKNHYQARELKKWVVDQTQGKNTFRIYREKYSLRCDDGGTKYLNSVLSCELTNQASGEVTVKHFESEARESLPHDPRHQDHFQISVKMSSEGVVNAVLVRKQGQQELSAPEAVDAILWPYLMKNK